MELRGFFFNERHETARKKSPGENVFSGVMVAGIGFEPMTFRL